MKKLYPAACILLGAMMALALPAQAGRQLTSEELRKLFSGKTIHAYKEAKRVVFVHYFAPDGVSHHTDMKGNPYTGKWWVNDINQVCNENKYFSGCYPVFDNDGVFQKMDGDVVIDTIKEVKDGDRR